MPTRRTFQGKNRASESLHPTLSMLECVLNLPQAFHEEKIFLVGTKFSKSIFAPCFLRDNF